MKDSPYAAPVEAPDRLRIGFPWRYLAALILGGSSLAMAVAIYRSFWFLYRLAEMKEETEDFWPRMILQFGPVAVSGCLGAGIGSLFRKPAQGMGLGTAFGVVMGCGIWWIAPVVLMK